MDDGKRGAPSRSWRDSVVNSLKWSAIGRLSAQAVTWTTTLVVIRFLSPSDYGLMASAMIVISLAVIVRDLGVVPAIIQSRDISERDLMSCKASVYVVAISLAVVIVVLSFPIANLMEEPRLIPILQVLAVPFLLTPVGTVEAAVLRKNMQFKKISVSELSAALLASLVLLGLALAGAGVWSLVAGGFVNQVATSFAYKLSYGQRIGLTTDLRPAMRYIRFGISASLQQLVFTCTVSLTNFLIGQIHGVVALGLYAVARDLSRLPVNKAMPIVNSVMVPAFSAVQHDLEKIRNGYLVGGGALSAFWVVTLWGLAGTADAVVPLVLGEQWRPATSLIQIISLWLPLSALMHLFPSIAVATGHPKQALIQDVVNLLLTGLAIGITAFMGIEGCMIGLGIAAIVGAVDAAFRTSRILHCSVFWFFRPLLVPIIPGLAMLAALWGLREIGPQPADGLANLLVRIIGGVLVYGGAFMLVGSRDVAAYRKILFK